MGAHPRSVHAAQHECAHSLPPPLAATLAAALLAAALARLALADAMPAELVVELAKGGADRHAAQRVRLRAARRRRPHEQQDGGVGRDAVAVDEGEVAHRRAVRLARQRARPLRRDGDRALERVAARRGDCGGHAAVAAVGAASHVPVHRVGRHLERQLPLVEHVVLLQQRGRLRVAAAPRGQQLVAVRGQPLRLLLHLLPRAQRVLQQHRHQPRRARREAHHCAVAHVVRRHPRLGRVLRAAHQRRLAHVVLDHQRRVERPVVEHDDGEVDVVAPLRLDHKGAFKGRALLALLLGLARRAPAREVVVEHKGERHEAQVDEARAHVVELRVDLDALPVRVQPLQHHAAHAALLHLVRHGLQPLHDGAEELAVLHAVGGHLGALGARAVVGRPDAVVRKVDLGLARPLLRDGVEPVGRPLVVELVPEEKVKVGAARHREVGHVVLARARRDEGLPLELGRLEAHLAEVLEAVASRRLGALGEVGQVEGEAVKLHEHVDALVDERVARREQHLRLRLARVHVHAVDGVARAQRDHVPARRRGEGRAGRPHHEADGADDVVRPRRVGELARRRDGLNVQRADDERRDGVHVGHAGERRRAVGVPLVRAVGGARDGAPHAAAAREQTRPPRGRGARAPEKVRLERRLRVVRQRRVRLVALAGEGAHRREAHAPVRARQAAPLVVEAQRAAVEALHAVDGHVGVRRPEAAAALLDRGHVGGPVVVELGAEAGHVHADVGAVGAAAEDGGGQPALRRLRRQPLRLGEQLVVAQLVAQARRRQRHRVREDDVLHLEVGQRRGGGGGGGGGRGGGGWRRRRHDKEARARERRKAVESAARWTAGACVRPALTR